MKKTTKSAIGTSFHSQTIKTNVMKLEELFGKANYEHNDGNDKTNFDWTLDFKGNVITIYDWKEYRPISKDEIIEFHIGGKNGLITKEAKDYLENII